MLMFGHNQWHYKTCQRFDWLVKANSLLSMGIFTSFGISIVEQSFRTQYRQNNSFSSVLPSTSLFLVINA